MTRLLLAILLIETALIFYFNHRLTDLQSAYDIEVVNNKAHERNDIKSQLTIDELEASKDSINQVINRVRDSLKIKDKNLKEVTYITNQVYKVDTLLISDTIFAPQVCIDTLIEDRPWYRLRMNLEYPNSMIIQPEFTIDNVLITSTKRETVNPPKKFFLFRWFQKKHTVTTVTVVTENPYVKLTGMKSIDIIN